MGKIGLILGNSKIKYSINLNSVAKKLGLLELVFFSCSKNTMYNFCVPILSSSHLSELKLITVGFMLMCFGYKPLGVAVLHQLKVLKQQVRVRNMREMRCCPNVLNYTTPLKGNSTSK